MAVVTDVDGKLTFQVRNGDAKARRVASLTHRWEVMDLPEERSVISDFSRASEIHSEARERSTR